MIDLDSLDGIDIVTGTLNELRGAPLSIAPQATADYTEDQSKSSPYSMSRQDENLLTCMLITANVGTIFEESTLLELWSQQLKSYLANVRPQIVAIHCQEVGGKNYESSMKNVSNFTDKIIGDESIIKDYSRFKIFLDENFEDIEKFTALGSMYLVHNSVVDVKLYNFKTAEYEPLEDRPIRNVNKVAGKSFQSTKSVPDHLEKVKFPLELFPECRWSRKGFMRTRWLFNDCQPLDLVNIHLFHDVSNLVAMEATPSPYAQNRQRALEYTLECLSRRLGSELSDQKLDDKRQQPEFANRQATQTTSPTTNDREEVPLFIFGDFNFRLDTNKVIKRITDGISPVVKKSADGREVVEFVYHRKTSQSDLTPQQLQNVDLSSSSSLKENPESCAKSRTHVQNECRNDENSIEKGEGVLMTVGKKLFDFERLDETFRATKNTEWLLELDNELDSFRKKLHEFKISFSPSYPFKEDKTGGYSYMKTRCPAWCDRILFNTAGSRIIFSKNIKDNESTIEESEKKIDILQKQGDVIYRLMGNSVPMGDHKPVFLYCILKMAPGNKVGSQN